MTDARASSGSWLLTDLSLVPEDDAAFAALSNRDEALFVGDVEDHLLIPLWEEDQPSVATLLRAGLAAVIETVLDGPALARALAARQFYVHPTSGRISAFQLCVPLILCFFMMNAGPAMATHLMADLTTIVARGHSQTVFQFTRRGNTLEARLGDPAPAEILLAELTRAPDAPQPAEDQTSIDTTWVVHACALQGAEQVDKNYGPFPELTPEFAQRFDRFQRRLCIRSLARTDAAYLRAPLTLTLEEQLLTRARACGYWSEQAFSSFAYAFLILGETELEENANFTCHPSDVSPIVALASMTHHSRRASLRKRQLIQYGPEWGKDN